MQRFGDRDRAEGRDHRDGRPPDAGIPRQERRGAERSCERERKPAEHADAGQRDGDLARHARERIRAEARQVRGHEDDERRQSRGHRPRRLWWVEPAHGGPGGDRGERGGQPERGRAAGVDAARDDHGGGERGEDRGERRVCERVVDHQHRA